MNVKLNICEVLPLLSMSYDMVYSKLINPIATRANLLMPEMKVGAGYLQWDLPGNDWTSFADADEETKSSVARVYHQRREIIRSALKGSPIENDVLMVPSERFIYFRPNGESWDIAITAWAHRFPNVVPISELFTWIIKRVTQEVQIGFMWADNLLPHFKFLLNGQPRETYADGLYKLDGKLEVGTILDIRLESGTAYSLIVEEGRMDYIYDLTQYMTVNIAVEKDEAPLGDCECEIDFNGTHHVTTDAQGHATLRLPLEYGISGMPALPQPECVVSCADQTQRATPVRSDEVLEFVFSFKTEEEHPVPNPEPPNPPNPPVPKFVVIRLQDYGGFPLPDLDFKLITKKKGTVDLKTDGNGRCIVPQEWFTHKEKMKVKFVITPEYRETHDLHDKKSKKK